MRLSTGMSGRTGGTPSTGLGEFVMSTTAHFTEITGRASTGTLTLTPTAGLGVLGITDGASHFRRFKCGFPSPPSTCSEIISLISSTSGASASHSPIITAALRGSTLSDAQKSLSLRLTSSAPASGKQIVHLNLLASWTVDTAIAPLGALDSSALTMSTCKVAE